MRRQKGAQTPYEVYCYHCDVTHPSGTRVCMHCGGRIGGHPLVLAEPGVGVMGATPGPRPAPADVLEGDEATGLSGPLRRIASMSPWMILFLSAAAYRACTGG